MKRVVFQETNESYCFQQNKVETNPKLLEWFLRSNYFENNSELP
jgi:hypothetical protein